jgi:hypothetical protein
MLASLLFPYDEDAPKRIDGWLKELEGQRCIVRYSVDGDHYLEVCNWLMHQKIDKPSRSKIPPFANVREDSPNAREDSSGDQGSKDQGSRIEGSGKGGDVGEGNGAHAPSSPPKTKASRIPENWTPSPDLIAYAERELPNVDAAKLAESFRDYWTAAAGEKARKLDWDATWRTWVRRSGDRYPTRKIEVKPQLRIDANGRVISGSLS